MIYNSEKNNNLFTKLQITRLKIVRYDINILENVTILFLKKLANYNIIRVQIIDYIF